MINGKQLDPVPPREKGRSSTVDLVRSRCTGVYGGSSRPTNTPHSGVVLIPDQLSLRLPVSRRDRNTFRLELGGDVMLIPVSQLRSWHEGEGFAVAKVCWFCTTVHPSDPQLRTPVDRKGGEKNGCGMVTWIRTN
ncbi:hypothetical protein ZHAS_00003179 [Anopheles sinensis]|uniref:Uncharacterized protein n=1 Tax=Anopheles sinensis TaxID=74873 RepID=A0A084VDT0_ANOSI|nr:hypothetical protein ZHAS_00003179 [Anopheles sinensis]